MTMSDDVSNDMSENPEAVAETGDDIVVDTAAPEPAAEPDTEVAATPVVAADDAEDDATEDDAAEAVVDDAEAPVAEEAAPADEPTEEPVADDAPAVEAEVEAEPDAIGEDQLLTEDGEPYENPFDKPGRWYVVHTQSGYEKKVKQNLEARTASMNMEGRIYETVIPMDDVVEFKGGKKVVVQKKMFPGYLLVRCELDDDSWYVVRNTPGIVNFVGAGGKPSPLRRREVETFLGAEPAGTQETGPKVKAKLAFSIGETVRVKEGPFADFTGEVVEINEDQMRVKVLVNIFGRETPVELEFGQVARL